VLKKIRPEWIKTGQKKDLNIFYLNYDFGMEPFLYIADAQKILFQNHLHFYSTFYYKKTGLVNFPSASIY